MARFYNCGIDSRLASFYKEPLDYSEVQKESEDWGTIELTIKVPTHGHRRTYERTVSAEKITYALASMTEEILEREMNKEIDVKKFKSFVVVVDTNDIIEEGYSNVRFYFKNQVKEEHDGILFFSCDLKYDDQGNPIITMVTVVPKKRMQLILHDPDDLVIASKSVNTELLVPKVI